MALWGSAACVCGDRKLFFHENHIRFFDPLFLLCICGQPSEKCREGGEKGGSVREVIFHRWAQTLAVVNHSSLMLSSYYYFTAFKSTHADSTDADIFLKALKPARAAPDVASSSSS